MNGVSPSGKASAFGADIRWFESSHPSHRIQTVRNDGFFFIYQAFILVRMLVHRQSMGQRVKIKKNIIIKTPK